MQIIGFRKELLALEFSLHSFYSSKNVVLSHGIYERTPNIETLVCTACTMSAGAAQPPGMCDTATYMTRPAEPYTIFHSTITINHCSKPDKSLVKKNVCIQWSFGNVVTPSMKADSNQANKNHGFAMGLSQHTNFCFMNLPSIHHCQHHDAEEFWLKLLGVSVNKAVTVLVPCLSSRVACFYWFFPEHREQTGPDFHFAE